MHARRATGVVLLIALIGLVMTAGAGHAHGRVVVGIGPWWDPFWPYPYPYYAYGPPYWWYPPYYNYPPPVVEEPPVYIQREPPPQEDQHSLPAGFWYYCPSPSGSGYYPTVPRCPEPWIAVAPRSP